MGCAAVERRQGTRELWLGVGQRRGRSRQVGCGSAETLCGCVRHAEVDADQRVGVSSQEHAEIQPVKVKGELAELRRVHEIALRWSAGSFRPPSDPVLSG